MKKRKERTVLENITVDGLAAEGKAIAKIDGMVIFISGGAVPGDVVDIVLTKKKKNHAEGFVAKIVKPASNALEPFCLHFGICGGCTGQRLPYDEQLKYKRQQIFDQITRLGGFENPRIEPVIPSEKTTYYRNKLEYTFSRRSRFASDEIGNDVTFDTNGLGFHIPGRFDKVLDIKKCYLQPEPSDSVRLFVKKTALKEGMEFFDSRRREGFLRNIVIRTSSTGEVMICIVFFYDDDEKRTCLLEQIKSEFPEITSLYYVINPKLNDSIADLTPVPYSGNGYICEKMEGLTFRIGPKSFYQTNSEQAYNLYKTVREYARLTGNETVYDLYTGIGTIANFLAKDAKKVVGIEYVSEAIEDAKINSIINGITNTSFFAGDIKDILDNDFVRTNGKPDVVILDPPRAGVHPSALKTLIETSPHRIVYVSCNPATHARDAAILATDYDLLKIQPVDMFPCTRHIECVTLLTAK